MNTSPMQIMRLKEEILHIKKLITCPICLDSLNTPVSTQCEHVFCSDCLNEALTHRNACPLCTQKVAKLSVKDINGISDIIIAFDQFRKAAESLETIEGKTSSSTTHPSSPTLSLLPVNPLRNEVLSDATTTPSPLPLDTSVVTIVLEDNRFEEGTLVNVLPRTWAGINKLGGVGRVESYRELEDTMVYTIKYVLDGHKDEDVPAAFIEKYVELGRNNRRRANDMPPDADKGKKAKTKQNKEDWYFTPSPVTSSSSSSTATIAEKRAKKTVILTTGIDSKYNIDQKLENLLVSFENASLSCGFTEEVTHLIVSTDRNNVMKQRTMKYMQALARGIWIVTTKWLDDSLAAGKLLPEADYEVRGNIKAYIEHAPRRARMAQQSKINLPLADYKVLFHGPFPLPGPAKSDLEFMVKSCGGTILSSVVHVQDSVRLGCAIDKHVIVCSSGEFITMPEVLSILPVELVEAPIVTATWVLDSVTNYTYVNVKSYPLV